MPEPLKPFYLTTPIYYVNARPHIGHAYTTIVGDVIARRERLLRGASGKEDVFFLTGTDEHGQKIERSAAAAGIAPQEFADKTSKTFSDLFARMGITNDQFIRTTTEEHKRGAQKLFRTLFENGHIYLDSYTGAYCVSDEAFVDAPVGTPCPDCGKLLEEVTEENFFFNLSEFQERLIELIESGGLRITPESAKNEVLQFVRGGLRDLSVSRSSFTWGIPVPEDIQQAAGAQQKHVIYVWLDALANYMTALGYGSDDDALWKKFWPADLHLVGKEITRFHCVYWPAFLMAAELPTPKQITANGWLLFDNAKMSKSKGNVVRTETILDAFGSLCVEGTPAEDRDLFASDVLRYYLLREVPFGQDGSFSFEAMVTRYNADLANGYGNLVSRTLTLIANNFEGAVPARAQMAGDEGELRTILESACAQATRWFEPASFEAAGHLSNCVSSVDAYLSAHAPWKLAKLADEASRAKLDEVLYTAAEAIRIVTALLYPILPYATAEVWKQLGLGDIEVAAAHGELKNLQWGGLQAKTKLGALGPVFPRAPKELAQTMSDMETTKETTATPPTTTAPDAGPRTASLDGPSGTLPVGGSAALTTGPDPSLPGGGPAQAGDAAGPAATPTIAIDDFVKIDLRVAEIVVAERIPKADKLLRLEVDLGPMGRRQILSGIAEFYTPEELVGRRIVVIANLAPRKMRGLESHGMLLAASDGEHGKPMLVGCGEESVLGSRVR